MEWNPINRTTEGEFSEAATARMLEGWVKEGAINAIYNAALLLNTCLHQQRMMTKWLAGEAARNIGRAELEDEILQQAILNSDQN